MTRRSTPYGTYLPSLPVILLVVLDPIIKLSVQVVHSPFRGPLFESQPRDCRFYRLSTETSDICRNMSELGREGFYLIKLFVS
jgi:hypothetical protein